MLPLDALCRSRGQCKTCRDPAQRAWRARLAAGFELPADAPDFECPQGLAWGFTGWPATIGTPPRRPLGDVLASWLTRLGFRKKPGCGCDARQAWMNTHGRQIVAGLEIGCGVAAWLVAAVGLMT